MSLGVSSRLATASHAFTGSAQNLSVTLGPGTKWLPLASVAFPLTAEASTRTLIWFLGSSPAKNVAPSNSHLPLTLGSLPGQGLVVVVVLFSSGLHGGLSSSPSFTTQSSS